MSRSNNPITSELPDMELMHSENTIDLRQQPPLYGVHLDVCRDRLEQDERGLPEEGPHRVQDQQHEQHTQRRVYVILVLPVRQPEHSGRTYHDHRAQSVGQHVEEHPAHVHLMAAIAVRVAMAMAVTVVVLHGRRRRLECLIVLVVIGAHQLCQTVSTT